MHEFSICEGIVKAAVEEVEKMTPRPKALRRARVVVGRLHAIVPDNMEMAYEVLTRDTPIAGSKLELEFVPIAAKCKVCGWEGSIEPPVFLCGSCLSGDIEVVTGRELYLANLEVEVDGNE